MNILYPNELEIGEMYLSNKSIIAFPVGGATDIDHDIIAHKIINIPANTCMMYLGIQKSSEKAPNHYCKIMVNGHIYLTYNKTKFSAMIFPLSDHVKLL